MLRLLLALSLIFISPTGFAKSKLHKKSKSISLKSYVLTVDQIKKLAPNDQLHYFLFLNSFVSMLETSQVFDGFDPRFNKAKIKEKNVFIKIKEQLNGYIAKLRINIVPEAEAIIPVLWVAAAGGRLALQGAIRYGPRYAPKAASYFKSSFTKAGAWFSRSRAGSGGWFSKGATTYVPKAQVWKAAALSSAGTMAFYEVEGMLGSGVDEPGLPAPGDGTTAPDSKSDSSAPAVATYRTPGNYCLYGGHISKYKKFSNGAVLCERPEHGTKEPSCQGTPGEPKFACSLAGLMVKMPSDDGATVVPSQTCIPLYGDNGVRDLTVRCTNAVSKWLVEQTPTLLGIENYNKFREALLVAVDKFETGRVGDSGLNFQEYCKDKNEANSGRQKSECTSMTGLIADLRKYSTVEQVIAEAKPEELPASAEPAAPAAPAAGEDGSNRI